MEKSEAIKEFQQNIDIPFGSNISREASELAIQALEEVQQYRTIGTMEELQTMKEHGGFTGVELVNIAAMQMKLKEYEAIGAPEECRKAIEKQIPRKPIFNHNLSDTLSLFHCECGNAIKVSHDTGIMNNNNAPNYCSKCGCRLDRSDEE